MFGYSIVNTKGQVTIPAKMRRKLGLKPGHKVRVVQDGFLATIHPSASYKSLRGIVPAREVPADFRKLKKDFGEYLGKRIVKND